jgi:FHA domain-containing protein
LAAADPFASLQLAPAPPSIDQMFGLGQSQQDPLAHFLADSPAPGSGGPSEGGVSVDPLQALFGSDAAPPLHTDPVQGDQLSALNQPFQPPRVAPPAAPRPQPPGSVLAGRPPSAAPERPLTAFRTGPAPAAPAARPAAPQVPAGSGADAAALWAALCQGAGVEMALPPGPPEEAMRKVGRILRSAVDGTLALMTVRASTRHELRATVTVIQAKGNNPLKFSADGKVALERLLQPAMRGFLEGPGAMEDAMLDLMGHSIGTVAGMRAALDGMLDRFAPAELEAKLVGKTVFENMLPGMRKARLWDLYLQHHGSIREEAQEDFHTLFGKAFLAAYEQQINQLFREPKP